MIKPQRHWLITPFFSWYISRIVKRHFRSVNFNPIDLQSGKAVLLIANHYSWWDGFVLYHLNKIHFKKQFRIMVLEETMREVRFFKYLGAFSIHKSSKQVTGSLVYAAELLTDPDNLVVIFPQGKLYSNFVNDVVFEKGAAKIAELATTHFQYLFSAAFTENFQHKKPAVNVGLKVLQNTEIAVAGLPGAYREHYRLAREKQTRITA
ncbi:hypothetical protein BEL04_14830 [Mucilaginibacter sp. PPCGB 2223]|uniref:lysophospholipid acyltransferase family protein n=1 Tax=Mucilaginibacter sp. PPCGB 2223 TaxID=1886027 RepID=UPI000826DF81|nr:lysophospholipid acyltransferase family protein [Mucilaginibacter sp. PPCGB 2223]OCX51305.1 hypothetical protein BEL04_14830 [Mucilaginibacter sp. PPCGB 2223]